MLDHHGLGTADAPIPVVLTCATGSVAAETLEGQREGATTKGWLQFMELKPFDTTEDALAYQWVLLNPRVLEGVPLARNVYAVVKHDGKWLGALRSMTKNGLPGRMNDPGFYALADAYADLKELEQGDDEDLMKAFQAGGGSARPSSPRNCRRSSTARAASSTSASASTRCCGSRCCRSGRMTWRTAASSRPRASR